MKLDENTYLILVLRYKELFSGIDVGGFDVIPYEIDGYLTEIDTGKIDSDYMRSRFEKYLKTLTQEYVDEAEMQRTLDDLHKSFAMLMQEEQKYANIFLNDVQRGDIKLESGKTFRITLLSINAGQRMNRFTGLHDTWGGWKEAPQSHVHKCIWGKYQWNGCFDDLKASLDKDKAKKYFEELENTKMAPYKVNIKVHNLLQDFILKGGFDIEEPAMKYSTNKQEE